MIQTNVFNLLNHTRFIKIKKIVSEFLNQKGFNEVDVPVLSPALIPESYLEIFKTEFIYGKNKTNYYLTPSPELFLKRLIKEGSGSVFTITKSFRNGETLSSRHSPEFTMLELYKVKADYFDIADDVIALFQTLSQKLFGKKSITYQDKTINLNSWEYITVSNAFKKYAGMSNILNHNIFYRESKQKGYKTNGFSYTDIWSQIYTQEVEPHLGTNGKPTLIYEYPIELAALAEIDKKKKIAKRFECYIEGVELGNCAQETSGKSFQTEKKRFMYDMKEREKRELIMHEADYEFLDAVKNLPKCAGIAIGLDRLAMVFTDSKSIEELQLISL